MTFQGPLLPSLSQAQRQALRERLMLLVAQDDRTEAAKLFAQHGPLSPLWTSLKWITSADRGSPDRSLPLAFALLSKLRDGALDAAALRAWVGMGVDLNETSVSPSAFGGGGSALHLLVMENHADSVRHWLAAGADPNVLNREKKTPLEAQVKASFAVKGLREALIDAGATVTNDLLFTWVAQWCNRKAGREDTTEFLLAYGQHPSLAPLWDQPGTTPGSEHLPTAEYVAWMVHKGMGPGDADARPILALLDRHRLNAQTPTAPQPARPLRM